MYKHIHAQGWNLNPQVCWGVVCALCWVGVAHDTCSLLGGWYVRCAGWAGGSGPGVLHMTRAVWGGTCAVLSGRGKRAGRVAHDTCSLLGGGEGWYVRCAGWAGGRKWARRVAHDMCSLLGGGEGAGRGGWGSSLTHQYLLIAQANMDSSAFLFFRGGHIMPRGHKLSAPITKIIKSIIMSVSPKSIECTDDARIECRNDTGTDF